ncbi:hypothetical protein [Actinoplanes sp. G11-F43]|uniref:hypothetical protein n=1 Tax=Actinoplanes sp. G11-F43 TaxID=3424130 RepID=UPI003D344E4D
MARVYVETTIDAPLDRIWAATQDHRQHSRWDVRFGRIDPVPGSTPAAFTYATAILPGVEIAGSGTHTGDRRTPGGGAVSALRFASPDPRSPIREGAGYWRYVPVAGKIKFLTGYAYRTRWGPAGRLIDLVFGPLFGWATAWSFDRLRLWLEHGVTPERALRNARTELTARLLFTVAVIAAGWWPLAPLAVLVPPHPHTPAARRCRRSPR